MFSSHAHKVQIMKISLKFLLNRCRGKFNLICIIFKKEIHKKCSDIKGKLSATYNFTCKSSSTVKILDHSPRNFVINDEELETVEKILLSSIWYLTVWTLDLS